MVKVRTQLPEELEVNVGVHRVSIITSIACQCG